MKLRLCSEMTSSFTGCVCVCAVSADGFRYTRLGGEVTIEGVDDSKDLEDTRRTFTLLGGHQQGWKVTELPCWSIQPLFPFSPGLEEDFQSDVFKVLAAILHLGNVEIRDSGGEKSSVPVSVSWGLCGGVDRPLTSFSSSPVTLTWPSSVSCWP